MQLSSHIPKAGAHTSVQAKSEAKPKAELTGAQEAKAVPQEVAEASPEQGDTATLSEAAKNGEAEAPKPTPEEIKKKRSRKLRKGFLGAASTGLGVLNAVASVPKGIQTGLDTIKGVSEEQKVLNEARISTLTSVAGASLAGMAVLGPVGFVVGGVIGYVGGTLGNHLASRSGTAEQDRNHVTEAVQNSVGESTGLWAKTKAVFTGAVEGAKTGYKTRKKTSKILLSGMADGISEAVDDVKNSKPESYPELAADSKYGTIKKTLLAAGGIMGGVAGVMINAPGGAVIGVLESLKETSSYVPSEMEKSLMLWATNVGKFLPAAAVSAFVGGAAGIAASTAVGVTTASLASIIDGRLGVNFKIARPVENAVKDAHGEEDVKENLRAYHRAGKGSVVGLVAGVQEGWKAGFKGGMEIITGTAASIPEAVDKEKEEKEA